jgi:EAL domain-containing protein (putative c-di-GMP-specific phosphodiesterase class I)
VFSINLPLAAALNKSTMTMMESLIRNSSNGERIIFEIQGAEWENHPESIRPYIAQLKNLGVRFAIDDFGSGKFSFESISSLFIDIIKIEGMLFKSWVDSHWGSTVVHSIIEYAQNANIITVAKEIDSEKALENALLYGVDMVQGFHIQRPVRWNELVQENNISTNFF